MNARRLVRRAAGAACGLAALALVGLSAARRCEDEIHRRIAAAAARRGLSARVDAVRVGLWPPIAVRGLRFDKPGVANLSVESLAVTPCSLGAWRFGLRVAVGRTTLDAPAAVSVEIAPTQWDVDPFGRIHARLKAPVGGLELEWHGVGRGDRFEGRAQNLPAGSVVTVRRDGAPLIDPGLVTGTGSVGVVEGNFTFEADVRGAGTRVAALANGDGPAASGAQSFGEPADVAVGIEGSWHETEHRLDVRRWRVASEAATLSGMLQLEGLPQDLALSLSLDVDRVDFAELFRASGLEQPLGVGPSENGEPAAGALGSAVLKATARGRLSDPRSFTVTQALDFTPPRRPLPALERLRGEFSHVVKRPDGGTATIDVSQRSPDFVALADVPPLFVRTLLLGEDSAFYGHHGVDLQALPEALLANWARGTAARGASTITQQLAKNLFLSGDKHLGRKVQELCLALLLEATLDKSRILEIYLNVIEWGPDLYGLRPAARRYFEREPDQLTPKQIAFLVALIPGPVKYQRSFADGSPSPAFTRLVDNLLAKLRSVDALTEDDYGAALAEPVDVAPARAPAAR